MITFFSQYPSSSFIICTHTIISPLSAEGILPKLLFVFRKRKKKNKEEKSKIETRHYNTMRVI